jgi:hypothetical protein
MSEIWFVNRGLVVLRPKEPFLAWVREADPSDSPLDDDAVESRPIAYLIPQLDGDDESWDWVRMNCGFLFEFACNEWYTTESLWPARRDWAAFQEWFGIEFIELVWDLVDEPLTSDPEAPEHQLD